jgi:hypothetical protein
MAQFFGRLLGSQDATACRHDDQNSFDYCATRLRRGALALAVEESMQGAAPRQQFSVKNAMSAFMPW